MVDPKPPPVRPASCEQCGKSLDSADSGPVCASCLIDLAKARWLDPSPSLESPLSIDSLRCLSETSNHGSIATSPPRHSRFGDYELLDEIARGGMGIVFRARQISLNRIVAIKMIRAGVLASELDIVRFQAEAQAAARLQHPNIIAIHEVGEHDERHYFSMAYVPGQNLAQCVREHPWAAPRAAHCLARIAEAVHYAHEHGILHRDLKPSNVIIDEDDTPHLTDFGLATRIEDASALTLSGAILGTPSYMAPEQTGGRRFEIGPRTDIYALGALLYEVLTGHPPFQGETPLDTIKLVRETDPVPPRRVNPRIPADLETITLKCLEKDPRKRYSTARELAEDLTRFLSNQPIHARPARVWEIAGKWIHRNPWRAALAAAVTLALLVTSAFWLEIIANRRLADLNRQLTDLNRKLTEAGERLEDSLREKQTALDREKEQRIRAENADRETRAAMAELEKAREAANRAQYQTRIAEAQQAIAANNLAEAERLLNQCAPEFRRWEWYYLQKLITPEKEKYQLATVPIRQIGLSTKANRAVAIDETGQIRSVDLTTGAVTNWFKAPPPSMYAMNLSALAVESLQPRAIAGVKRSGGLLNSLSTKWPYEPVSYGDIRTVPQDLALSADDSILACVGGDELTAWDAIRGSCLWRLQIPTGFSSQTTAISADGRFIAWILHTPETDLHANPLPARGEIVLIHRGSDGSLVRDFRSEIVDVRAIALSRNGDRLATGHGDGRIRIWEVSTGQSKGTLSGHSGPVHHMAFSQEGSQLVSGGADHEVRLWSLEITGEFSVFRGNRAYIQKVGLSADGKTVISVSQDSWVRVWSVTTPKPYVESKTTSGDLTFLDNETLIAPNGKVYSAIDASEIASDCTSNNYGRVQSAPGTGWFTLNSKPYQMIQGFPVPALNQLGFEITNSHRLRIQCAAIDPSGKYIAFSEDRQNLVIRSLENGALLNVLEVAETGTTNQPIYDVRFSPDAAHVLLARGSWQLSRSGQAISELQLWDWGNSRLLHLLTPGRFPIWTAIFIPNGRRIVSTGGIAMPVDGDSVAHPHGEILVWDASSGCELFSLNGVHDNAFGIAVSPDGTRLAAAFGKMNSNSPGQVKIWDLDTGDELLSLRGFSGPVYGVAFSPNGKRLAAIGPDTLRIWSID